MSTIYIQEPPTYGKVLLKTTVGDIDIELWSKEAPLASRNFIQLCMEKYYDNTTFHRVVKGFIVQGGDPSGSGSGGESSFGEPFKDEFHSRLRFNKRGLVAMANAGKNDNGSQFFFTLAPTPELQNKHTIFGKVGGNTIFNMLKLEEGLVVDEDRPMYPQKILSAEIILNPFLDIIPREDRMPAPVTKKTKTMEVQGVKNFKLLSFGDEAEEDEEDLLEAHKNFVNKPKAVPGLIEEPLPQPEPEPPVEETPKLTGLDYVKSKLAKKSNKEANPDKESEEKPSNDVKDDSGSDQDLPNKKKKTKSDESDDEEAKKIDEEAKRIAEEQKKIDEAERLKRERLREEYQAMMNPYAHLKRSKAKAKTSEDITLKKLKEFQNKIRNLQSAENPESTNKEDDWITHKLTAPERKEVLAKDANTMSDEWFDITDPRNSINKRKRKEI